VVVVDWVAGSSDAQEVSMTPTSVEKSEIAIVNFFIVAFDFASLSVELVVFSIIMTSIPFMLAAFSAHVLAVNPMVTEARHMARDPDHFIVAVPIARAMVVKRPVANLD